MRRPPGIGFNPGRMDTLRMLMHLPNFIKLYTRLWSDKRVGALPKIILALGIIYFLFPIDALTDFLVPIGYLDDAVVLAAALWAFIRLCPRRVVAEHVEIIDQGG